MERRSDLKEDASDLVGCGWRSKILESWREKDRHRIVDVLTDSWSNQLWTALQAWYLYPQARAPDIQAYYKSRRPTMDSVNTASKRPYSTLPRNGRVPQNL
jgi:hypothetical protein